MTVARIPKYLFFGFSLEYWCISWVLLICTISGQIWTQYTWRQYIVFMDTSNILILSCMCSVNDPGSYLEISDHNIFSRIQIKSVANLDVSDIEFDISLEVIYWLWSHWELQTISDVYSVFSWHNPYLIKYGWHIHLLVIYKVWIWRIAVYRNILTFFSKVKSHISWIQ